MRTSTFAATASLLTALVAGQTFTDCDPTKETCEPNPGLGGTLEVDFRKGASDDFELADGTSLTYDPELGAEFVIGKQGGAPTIGTNKYIMFGKIEVVMRASPGTGTVSSFILESDDLDEVDWEWLGSDHGNVQSNFFGKGNTTTYDRAKYHPISDPITTFHTYTIDWTAESLKWYVNGDLLRTLPYNDPLALGGKNYPQTPMRVKLGSWIGCANEAAMTDPKTQGTCEWAGGPIDLTQAPYTMYVQSVKIEDYGCGGEYTYSDMSGSWQSIKSSGTCDGSQSKPPTASTKTSTTATPSADSTSASTTATTPGAILVETSSSTSATSAQANATSSAATSAATSDATAASTLTTATSAGASGTSSTSSLPAEVTANAASTVGPKKYGVIDVIVVGLGLGMGYLFM